jgi:predicted TIM-barrel fold metal-dependent hydrolase
MRDDLRIIDSDAHVIEPHTVWTDYLDPALRDRAPRPVGITFGFEFEQFSVNLPRQWSPDATPEELEHMSERIQATYAELFPDAYAKGFAPDAQLVDMDREGIDRAFLYPSFGLFALASDEIDPELAVGIARAYNDWMADFVATDPGRLFGVAMIPLQDPAGAANEAARCATELGFRGAFVRPNPVCGRNFDDPAYAELWSVMSDHSMALGIHEGGFPRLPQVVNGRLTHPQQVHICTHPMEQMISAVSLIYGGVLERCPGLRVAFLEAGCGWVPFWLHRMDEHWEDSTRKDFGLTGITELPPSEYFRRQCYVSADASEYMLAQVIELIGDDKIVFTTDYPHPDSPWPHAVEEFLALPGVPVESKRKILWDNSLALYGIENSPLS